MMFWASWTNYLPYNLNKQILEEADLEKADFRFEDLQKLANLLLSLKEM